MADAAPQPNIVNVVDPDGNLVGLPQDQVADAIQNGGYSPATQEHVDAYVRQQAYGGAGNALRAGLESAGRAATFGALTPIETSLGVPPEDIAGVEQEHPIASTVGAGVGLIASSLTGVGEGAALESLGQAASDAANLGTATFGAKVGSAAVKAAAENALYQSGDEFHRYFSDQEDPSTPVQTAVVDTLGAGLLGGALGAAGGAISPLWKATVGDKLGGTLGALVSHLGGREGAAEQTEVGRALDLLGITDVPPEAMGPLSEDPAIKNMASILVQSPSSIGENYNQTVKNLRQSVIESMGRSLGKEPEELSGEFSQAEAGSQIGKTLADEYAEKMAPIADQFEANKAKYGSAELAPSMAERAPDLADTQNKLRIKLDKTNKLLQKSLASNDVEGALAHSATIEDLQSKIDSLNTTAKIPGTVDNISHELGTLANQNKWALNEDISKQLQKVMSQLPQMKTISDLQSEMSRLGSVARDLRVKTFGQATEESRAVEMMRGVLRNAEENSVASSIGSEEGEEALNKFNQARKDFSGVANLKEELDDRLKIRGSSTNYAKGIAAMAKEQPEKIFTKLSGKGDSALLDVISKNFPKTAEAVKEAHLQDLIAKSVRGAKNGDALNPTTLRKSLSEMAGKSPELRNFLFDKPTQGKLEAASLLLEKMNDPNYNFSHTGPVLAKLTKYIPSSAMGLLGILTGHGAGASLIAAELMHHLGNTAPDAVRLALLKFLGSGKSIKPGAFKATVDFMKRTIRGENAIKGAVSSIFKTGREVLPSRLIADKRDNELLEKHLEKAQNNPTSMLETAQDESGLGHYMPNHATAQAQTAANVAQYLNSIKPKTAPNSPLGEKKELSSTTKAQYQNALTIANQPLTVLQKIKDGNLTQVDVKHINAMYPALAQSLRNKLTAEMANRKSGDEVIPYKTKMALSLFMAQPLDSTLQPQSIVAAQPQPMQSPQQQGGPAPGRNKHSTASLGKMNSMYKTPSQAADQDRQRD